MIQLNIKEYFQQEKEKLRESCSEAPYLVIIDPTPQDKGNQLYVRNKVKDFTEMGWGVEVRRTETVEEYEQARREAMLQATAIIVQKPSLFPIVDDISPYLDADGLCPNAIVLPATVRGVVDYLETCGVRFEGLSTVVLGRSKIVGKPMADELLRRNATVSICHSKTPPPVERRLLYTADLVICAMGRPAAINRGIVNPDAIVVDVGINYVDGKIVGDFNEMPELCKNGWSTPVPGGVGLLTRLGLMKNCMELMNL